MTLPPLEHIPPHIASVTDYEQLAKERLSESIWAYFAGGAGNEWTLRENIAAFDRLPLRPRVLQNLSPASTATRILGCDLAAPILLAPVAFQRMAHADGELASVVAASALDSGMIISTQASMDMDVLADQASAPLWFQLYIQPDRDFTAALVARAERAGYRALVVTVDAPVTGMRWREQRAGFAMPADVQPVNLAGMKSVPPAPSDALLFGTPLAAAAPTWEEISWLRSLTGLPILLKGITHADDARRAINVGVDGIIVSNHGGRALDGTAAAVDLLPPVVAAVDGAIPVLMDGGIRRGTDVLRALALGAAAVLIGRPYILALAAAGAPGVAHVIRMLRAELELAMALTGCTDVNAIPRQILAVAR